MNAPAWVTADQSTAVGAVYSRTMSRTMTARMSARIATKRVSTSTYHFHPLSRDSHDLAPQSVGGEGLSPWSLSNLAFAESVPFPH